MQIISRFCRGEGPHWPTPLSAAPLGVFSNFSVGNFRTFGDGDKKGDPQAVVVERDLCVSMYKSGELESSPPQRAPKSSH